ncbi:MAG: TIGR04076 family protein [Candidatus Thorarchaeota archaeon]
MSPVGFQIVGTIKEIKGKCNAGHKVGDRFELDGLDSGGLCGFFYHDIFPYLITLQFGGSFPWNENQDIAEYECPDRTNAVKIELRRIRE